MYLTQTQIKQFKENGYLTIPGAVPKAMTDRSLRAINHSLGEEGMNKEDLPTLRAQSYCKEMRDHAAITGLFNDSPVFACGEQLLGAGNLNKATGGQIALRFPRPQGVWTHRPRRDILMGWEAG